MRLVTFVEAGAERLGFLVGDTVVDPLRAFGERSGDARALFADAAAFIRSGDKGIAAARAMLADPPRQALLPRSGVTLTAPLRPSTILCSGSNYHDHNAEKANTPISGKEPEFFVKTADCVVGPDEPIVQDPALTREARLRDRACDRHRQARAAHPGRAARSITSSATPSSTT